MPAAWDNLTGSGLSSMPFTETCAGPGTEVSEAPGLWAGSIAFMEALSFSDKILGGGVGGFPPSLGVASEVSEHSIGRGSTFSASGDSSGLGFSQLTFSLSDRTLLGGCSKPLSFPTRVSESSWLSGWASEFAETGVGALSPTVVSTLSPRLVISGAGEGLVGGMGGRSISRGWAALTSSLGVNTGGPLSRTSRSRRKSPSEAALATSFRWTLVGGRRFWPARTRSRVTCSRAQLLSTFTSSKALFLPRLIPSLRALIQDSFSSPLGAWNLMSLTCRGHGWGGWQKFNQAHM